MHLHVIVTGVCEGALIRGSQPTLLSLVLDVVCCAGITMTLMRNGMVSATRRNATGTGAAAGAMRNAAAGKKVRLCWTAMEKRQGPVHPWLSSASSAMFCSSQERLSTQLELMLCGCCGVCADGEPGEVEEGEV